jgi:hypothetical protein
MGFQREREHKEEVDKLHNIIDDLRERLRFTETQLSKARNEKVSLELELKNTQEKLKVGVNEGSSLSLQKTSLPSVSSLTSFVVSSLQKTESLLEVRSSLVKSKQQQLQELMEQINNLSAEKNDSLNKTQLELQEKVSCLVLFCLSPFARHKQTQDLKLKSTQMKLQLAEEKLKEKTEEIKYVSKMAEDRTSKLEDLEEMQRG